MKAPRGAAVTELALIVPVLVTIFFFGMYFSELVRAKLKLLEASRFAAWELTSYVLDDYGGAAVNRHERAFAEAQSKTVAEAGRRFADLDSVAQRPSSGFIAGYSGFTTTLENQSAPLEASFSPVPPRSMPLPPRDLTGNASQVHQLFGFNTRGKVQAEVSVKLDNRILPKNFLNDRRGFFVADQWGGRNLQSLTLRSRFTMIASGWNLPDGADAIMQKDEARGGRVAGLHRGDSTHALWLQVNRMAHLGVRQAETDLVGLKSIDVASFLLPHPYTSTFVVSHNYGLPNAIDRGCTSGRGNADPSHPEPSGMNNLWVASELDVPYRKCYDTVPFRDTSDYDESLSVQQYVNRGQHFMGCLNAQADDPSHAARSPWGRGDFNRRKIECGGQGP